ncbi:hypothetical protein FDK38_005193 [Candidozyma auris]|nr:hypothetical protein FDK38_005193 [[Candida] auris]
MAKEKLSVAPTTPIDLDEVDDSAKDTKAETSDKKPETDKESESKDEVKDDKDEEKEDKKEDTKDKNEDKEEKEDKSSGKGSSKKADEESDAPPPPARPLSPLSQVKKDLKDAFPQIEDKYIQAILIASQGQPDPAFNALLYLSDPTYTPDIAIPAPPPVPPKQQDLTDDELLARQLQKEFEREERRRRSQHRKKSAPPPGEESPDEIEQLKETFTQGFEEAKSTINGWVSGLSRKFSQDPNENQNRSGQNRGQNRTQSPKLFGALGGSSFNQNQRAKRFDEDPEILSSDFHDHVNLHSEKAPSLPKRERPKEEEQHKWQPLNSDVPVTSDAFLVTDSEDEEPSNTATGAAATSTTDSKK